MHIRIIRIPKQVQEMYPPLLPCLLYLSGFPTARSVSAPSCIPVLHPQLGIGSPSGPVGHGASRPGGPVAPVSPFLPRLPFLPGSPWQKKQDGNNWCIGYSPPCQLGLSPPYPPSYQEYHPHPATHPHPGYQGTNSKDITGIPSCPGSPFTPGAPPSP